MFSSPSVFFYSAVFSLAIASSYFRQRVTLFKRWELQVLEAFDFLEELVEHAGLGQVLDFLECQCVVFIGTNVLLSLKADNVQLEHGTDGGMRFDKAHVDDYKKFSTK